MKTSKLVEMTLEELHDHLDEQQNRLSTMRMTHTVSPLENPNTIGEARKEIARTKTELRRRQLAEAQN